MSGAPTASSPRRAAATAAVAGGGSSRGSGGAGGSGVSGGGGSRGVGGGSNGGGGGSGIGGSNGGGNEKKEMYKGPWTPYEDAAVTALVQQLGTKKWSAVASALPGRLGKQCRERCVSIFHSINDEGIIFQHDRGYFVAGPVTRLSTSAPLPPL